MKIFEKNSIVRDLENNYFRVINYENFWVYCLPLFDDLTPIIKEEKTEGGTIKFTLQQTQFFNLCFDKDKIIQDKRNLDYFLFLQYSESFDLLVIPLDKNKEFFEDEEQDLEIIPREQTKYFNLV